MHLVGLSHCVYHDVRFSECEDILFSSPVSIVPGIHLSSSYFFLFLALQPPSGVVAPGKERKKKKKGGYQGRLKQNIFTFTEPRIVIHTREKDQQDAHFLLIIYFNEIILDVSNK